MRHCTIQIPCIERKSNHCVLQKRSVQKERFAAMMGHVSGSVGGVTRTLTVQTDQTRPTAVRAGFCVVTGLSFACFSCQCVRC